jgi:DhnA family fructose-bisphosphate aldolase class Ia
MDSRTGKKIRFGRLFNSSSGRTLIVAYSHGSFMGPMAGMASLEEMKRTAQALRAADGLMVSPGMVTALEEAFTGRDAPSLIVQIDWQSFSRKVLPYDEGAAASMTTVEQVAAAGGAAVMSYLYLGFQDPEREKMEIARNAALVRACERRGLLLMIEPRSASEKAKPGDKSDPAMMGFYARISAEIGADLVKVIDPGDDESLAEIVRSCPAPVLLAGGSRKADFDLALERARAAVKAGCAGLVYGRNIFQHPDPSGALSLLKDIVHPRPPGAITG